MLFPRREISQNHPVPGTDADYTTKDWYVNPSAEAMVAGDHLLMDEPGKMVPTEWYALHLQKTIGL